MLRHRKNVKQNSVGAQTNWHPATNSPLLSHNKPGFFKSLKNGLLNLSKQKAFSLILVVMLVAGLGTYLLLFSHANDPGAFADNWESIGGQTPSGPAASSLYAGNLNIFVRGTDNNVYHKSFSASGWSGWENLGGQTCSKPATIAWSSTYLVVVIRGCDNHVYYKSWNNGYWSAWNNLGGVTGSGPAVTSWGPGRLDVFVRGTDDQVYQKFFDSSTNTWSGWIPLGGQTRDDIAAVDMSFNNVNIFVRGTDDHVYQKYFSTGGWSGWFEVGQGWQTSHGLGVSTWGIYRLDLFMTGYDNEIYDLPFNGDAGGWGHWRALGGTSPSAPGAFSWGNGRIDVFAQGWDNGVWHSLYDTNVSVGSSIGIGNSLHWPQSIISPSNTYQAQVQADGNLTVRRNSDGVAIWATNTNGSGANELDFQTDGNLVLRPAGGAAVWATGTNTYGGNYLVMQDDGNLVMYNSSTARAVWSWETGKLPPPPAPRASLSGYVPGNASSAQIASAQAILITNSTTIPSGKMPALTYSCINATTGYINGIQISGTSGTIYKPAITQPTTYTLTCVGPGGSASSTFSVSIAKYYTGPTPVPDEALQLNGINALRKAAGVPPVAVTTCLNKAARTWSENLGAQLLYTNLPLFQKSHSSDLAPPNNKGENGIGHNISHDFCSYGRTGYTGGHAVAENLGYAQGSCRGAVADNCSQLILNAFAAEKDPNYKGDRGHYLNIVDPIYTNVGVGEYLDAAHGVIYITHEFMTCAQQAPLLCPDSTIAGYGYP